MSTQLRPTRALNTRLSRRLLALGLAGTLAIPALALTQNGPQTSEKSAPLQASVSYQASPTPPQPATSTEAFINGTVFDENHRPLPGVTVWVPDWQTQLTTRNDGTFTLPARPVAKPVIISFQKSGYTPASATLDAQRRTLQITLTRGDTGTVVLDNQLRHLGDGSYAANSSGAGQFKGDTQGTTLRRQFRLHAGALPKTLGIGSVIGLDTALAQRAGQSRFHKTASPVSVVVNGQLIGYIGLNGDGHRLAIPPGVLVGNGLNTLEIQTGYQYPDGRRIDYDDIELMIVTLEL